MLLISCPRLQAGAGLRAGIGPWYTRYPGIARRITRGRRRCDAKRRRDGNVVLADVMPARAAHLCRTPARTDPRAAAGRRAGRGPRTTPGHTGDGATMWTIRRTIFRGARHAASPRSPDARHCFRRRAGIRRRRRRPSPRRAGPRPDGGRAGPRVSPRAARLADSGRPGDGGAVQRRLDHEEHPARLQPRRQPPDGVQSRRQLRAVVGAGRVPPAARHAARPRRQTSGPPTSTDTP